MSQMRTFLLACLTVLILLVMHLMPTMTVGEVTLRNVNILNDVMPEELKAADDTIDVIPQTVADNPLIAQAVQQQLYHPEGVELINDYSNGEAGGMAHFYRLLHGIDSLQRPLRIAYYGDSFIEGDILTGDMREFLQRDFGGHGVGWVDCGSEISGFRRTVNQRCRNMDFYEVVKHPFSSALQGISQRYFIPRKNASFGVRGTKYRTHASQWNVAQLYFRTSQELDIDAEYDGGEQQIRLHADSSCHVQMRELRGDMRRVNYRLDGVAGDACLFGMALESERGVILDNLSMRGSSGTTLARIPEQTLDDFARLRPYDLIILHYGLNVINQRSTAANYQAYVAQMKKVVSHLRKSYGDATILIVSVSDRGQRTSQGIRTLQGVETLVAYQQQMAAECGVAYLNLFKAMGGRGSMGEMVKKGWANKDYTHLSFAGGEHLAHCMYESLMAGLKNYELTCLNQLSVN